MHTTATDTQARRSELDAIAESNGLPLHLNAWWNDAVVGPKNWDVVFSRDKGGTPVGVFVYALATKFGQRVIQMPPLTAYSGPWIFYPDGIMSPHKQLVHETKVLQELLGKLPRTRAFFQLWYPEISQSLPFFWDGYRISTRYTFRIKLDSVEHVYAGFDTRVRTNIRKAEDELEVRVSRDADLLSSMMQKSFEAKDLHLHYPPALISALVNALLLHEAGKLYSAQDASGNVHAAVLVGFDQRCAYYITGGSDPEYRQSGAVSLLLWQAIKDSMGNQEWFDFEGSDLTEVYTFFKGFGGELSIFHRVTNARGIAMKVISMVRGYAYGG